MSNTWIKLIDDPINLKAQTKTIAPKGNLVYEYNPFRNYRLSEIKYHYKDAYYSLKELEETFGITQNQDQTAFIDSTGKIITEELELYEPGQLVDFITDQLNFSLEHPVHIIPQASYDGSVNLIINDGINTPRLINSRFSATGKNTYEIVDRQGSNDTNIYDEGDQFDIDTSLYKRLIKIPKIKYLGNVAGGNLKVGNYHFYFKLADDDGNESDFVGESGLVSVFIGFDNPSTIHTGNKNQNSYKTVQFYLSNLDDSYDYVTVYYSRYLSEDGLNSITEYKKINTRFAINNASTCTVLITGNEEDTTITAADINLHYNIVDAAKTSAVCQNMLFMANVHKPDIPYKELQDLSLRFIPHVHEESYELEMDEKYDISSISNGYYDPQYIYNKVGYWGGELYRLGIVYLLPNGELSPVFNIRGAIDIRHDTTFSQYDLFNENGDRNYITYNESTYYIIPPDGEDAIVGTNLKYENIKGVISLSPTNDTNTIYGIRVETSTQVMEELKKYVKGYFFVRQTRIPTILAQGITIGIDQNANTPCIPTRGGFLEELNSDALKKTHIETEDILGVNYISEGFLSRYKYYLKRKSSSLWSKIGKIAVVAIGAVAVAAACVVTVGAGAAAVIATAAVGAAAIAGTAAAALAQELKYNSYTFKKERYEGRHTSIPSNYKKVESDDSRLLTHEFYDRIIIKDPSKSKVQAILCPDYSLNQQLYNQIFTGNEHIIKSTKSQSYFQYFNNKDRHFYVPYYVDTENIFEYNFKVKGVPDNTKLVGLGTLKFRSRAGDAEEAWKYECVGDDYKSNKTVATDEEDAVTLDNKQINTDIVRGSFGPYLAFNNTGTSISPATTVNIYIPEYSKYNMEQYVKIRMEDSTTYNAISDRFDINEYKETSVLHNDQNINSTYSVTLFRGDCYLCQFTHRLNRNFNDPSAPYNDEIVNEKTWKNNYSTRESSKQMNINLGDVNAIQLGMWVTFRVRSSNNLNIRTLDGSNVDETAMQGHEKGFYPHHLMSPEGSYKHADSCIYNKGFSKSVSEKWNFTSPEVPHIKNWFGTRIMYSDIHINDAYKNGFRVFQGTHYRDYTREYGEITKLIPLESSLLCVFEHGVALIPVNERAVAGEGAGGNIYINTSNVLPENPKILSDMFGSQWPESILKVPGATGDSPQYIYGVDTVAKKIWRTNGQTLECISDFKVQEFLNNNITLGERELTPKIGIRNVKTHYNAFKRDVMFTFYDNTYGFEEKVWNLCWNELLQKFITFYSWVPSYMENINNIPFSFNRNTSKWIAKLGTSHSQNSFADGITLTNVVLEDSFRTSGEAVSNTIIPFKYLTKDKSWKTIKINANGVPKFIAGLSLENRVLPDSQMHYQIDYSLERDIIGNHKLFRIVSFNIVKQKGSNEYIYDGEGVYDKDDTAKGGFILPSDAMFAGQFVPIYALCFNTGDDEYQEVLYLNEATKEYCSVTDVNQDPIYYYKMLYSPEALYSELYYRNSAGNSYADYDTHKLGTTSITENNVPQYWIKDLETLRQLKEILPEDTIIGNTSTQYNDSNPPEYVFPCTNLGEIESLIEEKNGVLKVHGILLSQHWTISSTETVNNRKVWYNLPIFKDITGKRPTLPKNEQVNARNIVTLLNIKATISIVDSDNSRVSMSDAYYNMKASYAAGTTLVNAGQYESTVAIIPKWNIQFLSTDFWKHGQAGIIDIADDIKPTYWYGEQHPFEFECVVINDPSVHKIFQNLELVANKAKPESFHYEIIGDCYDFAKDKVNMYFRQEAMKALWQNNEADIVFDRNFLKVQPKQQPKSADFPHVYYTRQDTLNNVEDYYISSTYKSGYDYRHLSGAEVVYYPNRQEFRIWNHVPAVSMDDLLDTTNYWDKNGITSTNKIYNSNDKQYKQYYSGGRSIIGANCQYLEDKWRITINPIIVCYKNEYMQKFSGTLIQPLNSTWDNENKPPLPVMNSPIPELAYQTIIDRNGEVVIPDILTNLGYNSGDIDYSNWLSDKQIYNTTFGEAQNRKELDVKDKFMKVRIRYSGEELAVIDFLNTIYRVSYV